MKGLTTVASRQWLIVASTLIAVELVYIVVVSAATWGRWPTYMAYYDMLADAFKAGQLHLHVAPAPELLAQKDPYDPAFMNSWIWDLSLSNGKYYAYWGPLPALLQAAVKGALRINREIGDQYLVFFFASALTCVAGVIIKTLREALFPAVSFAWVPLAIAAFAFANPFPHLLASAGTYQTAIFAGQAFLLMGFLIALRTLTAASASASLSSLLGIGLLWGAALACRVSLAPAAALLVAITAAAATFRARGGFTRFVGAGACLSAPIAATLFLLLLYNKARFGQWLEFGTSVQLSTLKFRSSSDYLLSNLYAYLLRPLARACEFPFALQLVGPRGFPPSLLREGYLTGEPVVGLFVAVPIVIAGVVAVAAAAREGLRWIRSRGLPEGRGRGRALLLLWTTGCLLVLGTVTGLPELGLFMPTMRYLADVTPGLVLLGLLGMFATLDAAAAAPWFAIVRRLAVVAGCVATITLGLLLGYQGYTGHFARFNPSLHATLVKNLSVCTRP